MDKDNLPRHIAIIMDGNGRWAKERGLPRTAGHREGAKRVKEIVRAAGELGIKVLTLFAFSTENWKRPKREIDILMRFLDNFLDKEVPELDKNNVRFLTIGMGSPIPRSIQDKINKAKEKTAANTGLTLVLALNYGSRQEIIEAVKSFIQNALNKNEPLQDLDEEKFSARLFTAGLPDPDLLIRTSSEFRISNFLLWQLSYSELYFPKKYWPDFKRRDLEEAIKVFKARKRRFGGVDAD